MKKRYKERDMRLDAEAQHIFFDSFAQLKHNTLTKKIWARGELSFYSFLYANRKERRRNPIKIFRIKKRGEIADVLQIHGVHYWKVGDKEYVMKESYGPNKEIYK